MFGKIGDMGKMMKQAQEMQAKMGEMQAEIENIIIKGSAGGDMVHVTLNGKGIIKKIDIDPSLITPDDKEILEDLIMAAHNDAKQKSESVIAEKTKQVMGDIQLPEGMNLGL